MTEHSPHTLHDDAPLSAGKKPDATRAAVPGRNQPDDELVGRTVTINRSRQEIYEFWRDFRNLPRFMQNVQSVTIVDSVTSHWVVGGPGSSVEWDSILSEDHPNELLAWRSAPEAGVRNSGRVEFRDSSAGRGTEVTATVLYDPPLGALGKLVAKVFRKEPNVQTRQDLRRFKQLMETGEVSTAQSRTAAPRG